MQRVNCILPEDILLGLMGLRREWSLSYHLQGILCLVEMMRALDRGRSAFGCASCATPGKLYNLITAKPESHMHSSMRKLT